MPGLMLSGARARATARRARKACFSGCGAAPLNRSSPCFIDCLFETLTDGEMRNPQAITLDAATVTKKLREIRTSHRSPVLCDELMAHAQGVGG